MCCPLFDKNRPAEGGGRRQLSHLPRGLTSTPCVNEIESFIQGSTGEWVEELPAPFVAAILWEAIFIICYFFLLFLFFLYLYLGFSVVGLLFDCNARAAGREREREREKERERQYPDWT